MVTIENVSGRAKVYTLSGLHLASDSSNPHGYKPVRRVTTHQAKSGQVVARVTTRLMPDSLRIVAGGSVDVDDAVAHCPPIKGAIARGELRLASKKSTTPPAPAAGKRATTAVPDAEITRPETPDSKKAQEPAKESKP